MTRVLRSEIAEQPAPLSTVASSDGTVWTRYLHRDVDRWYGVHHVHGKRPVMLARTWPELAASGDLTVLSEPVECGIRSEWSLNGHPLDDLAAIPNDRLQGITTPKISDKLFSRVRGIHDLTDHELDVVSAIAAHYPHGGWDTRDVVSAYRRGIADGKTAA